MRKFIKKVTLTGADDFTKIEDMHKVSERYPFVEWGILLSASSSGRNRFPTHQWLERLWRNCNGMSLSGHVCGKWVREICHSDWSFYQDRKPVYDMFQRFQLNFHAMVHNMNHDAFLKGSFPEHASFIFQLDDVNNDLLKQAREQGLDARGLFDLSSGVGDLPQEWCASEDYIGYAGGLSPENLVEQLTQIEKVCGDEIWIDAETHVRSNNDQLFDLDKVVAFLEASKEYVITV